MSELSLDLRGTPCPVNFIRCRLMLETMQAGDHLQVQLDRGEPEQMVVPGLREEGHQVSIETSDHRSVKLQIICGH